MPFLSGSAWSGRFDYLLLELILLSEPPPAAERPWAGARLSPSRSQDRRRSACLRTQDQTSRPRGLPELPLQSVRARRAREANRDQDQAFEIVDFRAGRTGRRERSSKDFRHKRALRGRIGGAARICVLYLFLSNASAWSPPPNPVVRRADGRVRERFGEFCDR